ncbi:TraR/DksA C4-type zinc finger protein [Psychrobacter sp. CAM01]|uniref:TraR/DksA C4-type zinc finger protein n=1 Tax=Psychrobacter sp. CAM01 TaxID=3080335 RepID=UPI0029364FC1|nr:TraR/DksA C4-type zinc finger protein [Psychrobacter sp. CAM01]MDV2860313.1 TraR/DksA C4-type zinc finger protein [Psychrobacter sp. CAM01]
MADDIDRAGERIDAEMTARLRVLPVFDIPSLPECISCGEEIPSKRRAIGGVRRCFDCQKHHESSVRYWNHSRR